MLSSCCRDSTGGPSGTAKETGPSLLGVETLSRVLLMVNTGGQDTRERHQRQLDTAEVLTQRCFFILNCCCPSLVLCRAIMQRRGYCIADAWSSTRGMGAVGWVWRVKCRRSTSETPSQAISVSVVYSPGRVKPSVALDNTMTSLEFSEVP